MTQPSLPRRATAEDMRSNDDIIAELRAMAKSFRVGIFLSHAKEETATTIDTAADRLSAPPSAALPSTHDEAIRSEERSLSDLQREVIRATDALAMRLLGDPREGVSASASSPRPVPAEGGVTVNAKGETQLPRGWLTRDMARAAKSIASEFGCRPTEAPAPVRATGEPTEWRVVDYQGHHTHYWGPNAEVRAKERAALIRGVAEPLYLGPPSHLPPGTVPPEGWRPISTAPKDGTHVLALWPSKRRQAAFDTYWDSDQSQGDKPGWHAPGWGYLLDGYEPTGWMPHPAAAPSPPASETA